MPNAENLIQLSGDAVKTWHECACCSTPVRMEHEFCFSCESLPGRTAMEKRAADYRFAFSRRKA